MMLSDLVPAVTDIDTSGIHAMEELLRSLQKREIQVINSCTLTVLPPDMLWNLSLQINYSYIAVSHTPLVLTHKHM